MPSPKSTWRLIVDEPSRGCWNMAVDEVLLETAIESSPTLRFYSWSEPTLSIGYFQSYADRHSQLTRTTCHVVRRRSGGGAILHDHDVTYSLAVPVNDRWSGDAQRLYTTVHQTLVETFLARGIDSSMHEGESVTNKGGPHYLCFLRLGPGDVVVGGRKVAGSAQRRSRNAVIQHGSVLLARSSFAPQLEGIRELSDVSIDPRQLVRHWTSRLERRLEIRLVGGCLSGRETEKARRYVSERFGQVNWTQRR